MSRLEQTMKGAAKCDEQCELQDSVNPQKVERILLFWVTPESVFASVSFVFLRGVSLRCHVFVLSNSNVAFVAFFRSDVTCDQAAQVCIFQILGHEVQP